MTSTDQTGSRRERVVILGGGVAGLEATMALRDLAGDRVEVTIVAPEPDFVFKPMVVDEPFSLKPAEHRDLSALAEEFGSSFVLGAIRTVHPQSNRVELVDGKWLDYEHLIVAVGARALPALKGATTFWAGHSDLAIDELLERAARDRSESIALVVPIGCSWPLPLYELAMGTRTRAVELGLSKLTVRIYSPEPEPLSVFGPQASAAVAATLAGRRIEFHGNANVVEDDDGRLHVIAGGGDVDAGAVLALPTLTGPAVPGLPSDPDGFTPIDPACRVAGLRNVYAVGDGANFPVKQGGLAAQQADVAAEQIAADVGAPVEPGTFHPVLRGQLLAGEESLSMRHDLTGGHGEGNASLDSLWWPPGKVSGRYLTPWLTGTDGSSKLDPPTRSIDVEVALEADWHEKPVAMGSHPNPVHL